MGCDVSEVSEDQMSTEEKKYFYMITNLAYKENELKKEYDSIKNSINWTFEDYCGAFCLDSWQKINIRFRTFSNLQKIHTSPSVCFRYLRPEDQHIFNLIKLEPKEQAYCFQCLPANERTINNLAKLDPRYSKDSGLEMSTADYLIQEEEFKLIEYFNKRLKKNIYSFRKDISSEEWELAMYDIRNGGLKKMLETKQES